MRTRACQPSRFRIASAFTLIEMLVASAVLALMVVLATQLVTDASRTINTDGKTMDADSQARLVFDRLAQDFARLSPRHDVDFVFSKQGGNDKLFFFSEVPGISTASYQQSSPYSLVGYRTRMQDGLVSLERLSKGLAWQNSGSATSMVHLTFDAGGQLLAQSTIPGRWPTTVGTAPSYNGTDADYLELGSQVFRLEICFVLKDGSVAEVPVLNKPGSNLNAATAPGSDDTAPAGARWYDRAHGRGYLCVASTADASNWAPLGLQDVAEIVVGLGILDPASRAVVTEMSGLVTALADPSEADFSADPPRLMAQIWEEGLYSLVASPPSGVPGQAASQVRFYQRHFRLSPP